ncbi:MAG TPA: hypothetical protein VN643_18570 [Pyrinomonadaceae bacterium]|nr:hypothetical protein [Pyrinomonadaceae bacterium]
MKFTIPRINQPVTITSTPDWPSLSFETDLTGPHVWYWTLKWNTFQKSGMQNTTGNRWDATATITNYGGTLTVRAEAKQQMATIAVKILGTDPSIKEVNSYLAAKANTSGFEKILAQKILAHENNFRQFDDKREPKRSFDNGYGICQLTNPPPKFEQVWNWKLNIDAGVKLFGEKRSAAITYLSKNNHTYTAEQLKYETVCLWNGGHYHVWDAKASKWVRNPNILCDSKTGNMGWDMTDPQNKGKTEAQLSKRDFGSYSGGKPAPGSHWDHYGVCYADHLLR